MQDTGITFSGDSSYEDCEHFASIYSFFVKQWHYILYAMTTTSHVPNCNVEGTKQVFRVMR